MAISILENGLQDQVNALNSNISKCVKYGNSISGANLNDYKTPGIYYFSTNCTNTPTSGYNYLAMLVAGNGNVAIQFAFPVVTTENYLFFRQFGGSNWGAWKKISTSSV